MSFCDVDGRMRSSVHASKKQPKQSRHEDTSFEREIKSNIQELQDGIRMATERLDQAHRGALSIRAKKSLDSFLTISQELVKETELQFREWTVHFAGEPMERHRKRLSFEKLQRAFEKEFAQLKEVMSRYVALKQFKQDAMIHHQEALECEPMCSDQESEQSEVIGDLGEGHRLLGLKTDTQLEVDSTVHNCVVQEREDGIRHIQSEVSEVNQMFKDLACVVHTQGKQLGSIDRQSEEVQATTKEAVMALRKTAKRQAGTRENLCYMLLAALALLCFLVVPHLHASAYVSSDLAGLDHIGVLRGARPEEIVVQESPMAAEPPALPSVRFEPLPPSGAYVSPDLSGLDHVGVLRGARPEEILVQEGPMAAESPPLPSARFEPVPPSGAEVQLSVSQPTIRAFSSLGGLAASQDPQTMATPNAAAFTAAATPRSQEVSSSSPLAQVLPEAMASSDQAFSLSSSVSAAGSGVA